MATGNRKQSSRLTHLELAAVDLTITAMQAAGRTIDQAAGSGNPHEIMCEAVADAHRPFVELTERDREIIRQIKELASELSVRPSLRELVDARGRLVQGR